MGFVLPRVTKTKNGGELARQVIPADVRDEYERLYGKRWEERWRPDPTMFAAEQKRAYPTQIIFAMPVPHFDLICRGQIDVV